MHGNHLCHGDYPVSHHGPARKRAGVPRCPLPGQRRTAAAHHLARTLGRARGDADFSPRGPGDAARHRADLVAALAQGGLRLVRTHVEVGELLDDARDAAQGNSDALVNEEAHEYEQEDAADDSDGDGRPDHLLCRCREHVALRRGKHHPLGIHAFEMHRIEAIDGILSCLRRFVIDGRDGTLVKGLGDFRIGHGEGIVEALKDEIYIQSVSDRRSLPREYAVVILSLADSLRVLLNLRQTDVRTDDADDLPVHLDRRDITCHQFSILRLFRICKERLSRALHRLVPIALHGALHRAAIWSIPNGKRK